jgi:dihydroflavonol-4-reductase
MTVLVTGATGFVGASVARHLLADGEAVRVLVRPTSDPGNIEGLEVERAVGDLTDPESLAAACKGCSSVFHVAADYRLWTRNPDAMLATNVEGSRNLIRAAMAAGAERIVYTSSVAALGKTGTDEPADEQTPSTLADKIGIYKRSKFLAEEAVLAMIADDDAPVVIVNPSAPVGPRDIKPTPTGRMIVEAAAGRIPAFVDTGLNVVHVDDVAEGHMLAWKKGVIGEKYILGGENLTLAAILAEIATICGRRPPTIRLPRLAIMPIAFFAEGWTRLTGGDEPFVTVDQLKMAKKKMYYSSAKAERDLGYRARPVTEAFADAVSWFRENGYLD